MSTSLQIRKATFTFFLFIFVLKFSKFNWKDQGRDVKGGSGEEIQIQATVDFPLLANNLLLTKTFALVENSLFCSYFNCQLYFSHHPYFEGNKKPKECPWKSFFCWIGLVKGIGGCQNPSRPALSFLISQKIKFQIWTHNSKLPINICGVSKLNN